MTKMSLLTFPGGSINFVFTICEFVNLLKFHSRMREWLFNVMSELSERKELSYYYQEMEKEAKVSNNISCLFVCHVTGNIFFCRRTLL